MTEKLHSLVSIAKKLRRNETDTERRLWRFLRAKQLGGFKFQRQVPIGCYIVDFVCFEKKVIIECDGGQHIENKNQDQRRDIWLRSQDFQILRFWDNDILQDTQTVLEVILDKCQGKSPSP